MDNDRPFAPDEDDIPLEIFPGLRKTAEPAVPESAVVDDDDSIPLDIFDAAGQSAVPSPWTTPAGPPPAAALPSADELWPPDDPAPAERIDEAATEGIAEVVPEPILEPQPETVPVWTAPASLEPPPLPSPHEAMPFDGLEYPAPGPPIELLWRYEPETDVAEPVADPVDLEPETDLETAADLEPTIDLEPARNPEPAVTREAEVVTFDPMVLPDAPRRPSPRTFVRPKPFPVARPIRALAFDVVSPEPLLVEPTLVEPPLTVPPIATPPPVPLPCEPSSPVPAPSAALDLSQPITIEALLRVAVTRRASALYLSSDAVPSLRIDGEMTPIDGAPSLRAQEVDALLFSFTLAHHDDLRRASAVTELSAELPDVGRVRCSYFHDGRGAGAVLRIAPSAATIDPIALSSEIRSLASEPNGLLLVTGPRSSGKQLLIASIVEFISRTRPASVVVVQRGVFPALAPQRAVVSVRTVSGLDDVVTAARAALRENPDVLVLPEIGSAPLIELALDAAASGQLVVAGITAASASHALERIASLWPRESLRLVQPALAHHLRGIVGQILVPGVTGGLVAARELLLNTPVMAGILADGKSWQLPMAVEAGRRDGMQTLAEALAELVASGAITSDDAYRRAPDALRFVEALKRRGLDRSRT